MGMGDTGGVVGQVVRTGFLGVLALEYVQGYSLSLYGLD